MIKITQELIQELDAISLCQLLERCVDNDKYSAAVVFSYKDRKDEFMSELEEQIFSTDAMQVYRIQNVLGSRESTIEFFNGSKIDVFTTNGLNAKRPERYNEILYFDITDTALQEMLEPMIKPYDGWILISDNFQKIKPKYIEKLFKKIQEPAFKQAKEEKQSEQELDDFLSSFTIHS